MAKMIPHTAYETASEGEDRIFESLQTSLPDSYTVFHSVRWIGSDRKRSQGEADFIVFDSGIDDNNELYQKILAKPEILAVAISRTKKMFLCIGNKDIFIQKIGILNDFFENNKFYYFDL